MTTGEKIKKLRLQNHMSASVLAGKLGLSSPQAVYAYENGKTTPTYQKIELLATIFDVELNYFQSESNPSTVYADWKGEAYKKLEIENEKLWALVEKLTNSKLANFPDAPDEALRPLRIVA